MTPEQIEAVLDLEGRFWRDAGSKENAIRTELGLTPTRYYQRLRAALDHPHALAYAPMTVNRLRRILHGSR